MTSIKTISVIGLGKLGAPFLAACAVKGYRTIGIDVSETLVTALNNGIAPVHEPLLQNFITRGRKNIRATSSYEEAIIKSDATFIIVPTPSDIAGVFSNTYVEDVLLKMSTALKAKKKFHIITVVSTVMPGSTEKIFKPLIEKYSRKKCGKDFGLVYSPTFIALGSVIHDFLNPSVVLIGESDARTGKIMEHFYENLCENTPTIRRMNFVNAEIAKIALNTFVTTKISFANMIAEVCEETPGGDVDAVTEAIGHDPRVGHRYLKGGLGYGGPCFPRDNKALRRYAKNLGVEMQLASATDRVNLHQIKRLCNKISSLVSSRKTIGVVGLAYKPHTDVIEESQGMALARFFSKTRRVVVYDPLAMKNARKVLKKSVSYATSVADCVVQSDLVIAVLPLPEWKDVDFNLLGSDNRSRILVDCWRFIDRNKLPAELVYIPIGRYTSPNIWTGAKKKFS